MSRTIVFDRATADALRERTGVQPELRQESIRATKFLEMMVLSESSVAVMPGEEPGTAILMRVLRQEQRKAMARVPQVEAVDAASSDPPPPAAKRDQSGVLAPSGFLGLYDSVDMDTEPEKPKKWWQKLLD